MKNTEKVIFISDYKLYYGKIISVGKKTSKIEYITQPPFLNETTIRIKNDRIVKETDIIQALMTSKNKCYFIRKNQVKLNSDDIALYPGTDKWDTAINHFKRININD